MTNFYRDQNNVVRNKNELKRLEHALRKAGHSITPLDLRIKSGELTEVVMGFDGEWTELHHFAPLMEHRRPGSTKSNR